MATASAKRHEEIIAAIANRETHVVIARVPLLERLPMAALAAAGAENPAPAHHAAVTTAGFRRTGVKGVKCIDDIVERDRRASIRGSMAQFRYGLNCASIRCP